MGARKLKVADAPDEVIESLSEIADELMEGEDSNTKCTMGKDKGVFYSYQIYLLKRIEMQPCKVQKEVEGQEGKFESVWEEKKEMMVYVALSVFGATFQFNDAADDASDDACEEYCGREAVQRNLADRIGLTGKEALDIMDFLQDTASENVFNSLRPEQKSKIVRSLQAEEDQMKWLADKREKNRGYDTNSEILLQRKTRKSTQSQYHEDWT